MSSLHYPSTLGRVAASPLYFLPAVPTQCKMEAPPGQKLRVFLSLLYPHCLDETWKIVGSQRVVNE